MLPDLAWAGQKWSNGRVNYPSWSDLAMFATGDIRLPMAVAGVLAWSVNRSRALRIMGWTAWVYAFNASVFGTSFPSDWYAIVPTAWVGSLSCWWGLATWNSPSRAAHMIALAVAAALAVGSGVPPGAFAVAMVMAGALLRWGPGVDTFFSTGGLPGRLLLVASVSILCAWLRPVAAFHWGLLGGGLCAGLLTERRVRERFTVRSPRKDHIAKAVVGVLMVLVIAYVGRDWRSGALLFVHGCVMGAWWIGGVPFLARAPEYPPEGGAPAL